MFKDTLSAPARNAARMSSGLRTPPPTVSGTNTFPAVRRTASNRAPRPCGEAAMSKYTISSMPPEA